MVCGQTSPVSYSCSLPFMIVMDEEKQTDMILLDFTKFSVKCHIIASAVSFLCMV